MAAQRNSESSGVEDSPGNVPEMPIPYRLQKPAFASSFTYPPIPDDDQNLTVIYRSSNPWKHRLVPVKMSSSWVSNDTAAFRAQLIGHLTAENEAFPQRIISKGCGSSIAGLRILSDSIQDDVRNVSNAYRTQWPVEIGSLSVIFDTVTIQLAVEPLVTRCGIGAKPNAINPASSLGLKLRMNHGKEVITTAIRGFVKRPNPPRTCERVTIWIFRAKESLPHFRSPRPESTTAALVTSREKASPTPPHRHPSLDLRSPLGYPRITNWATYSDPLSGAALYTTYLNMSTGAKRVIEGGVDTPALKRATVCGTQYMRNNVFHTQKCKLTTAHA
ncbi:hypothetical protein ACJ72_06739 [Emergomyces africanus]|uniref:Uncharacterized protein n=1 Tax=Emergomyces africanus TaxID=1955775 RepID=A0A1B7NQ96_9EURO|nr:hypothetical protein ACJ72_06739 [Emergomyces africanus]